MICLWTCDIVLNDNLESHKFKIFTSPSALDGTDRIIFIYFLEYKAESLLEYTIGLIL